MPEQIVLAERNGVCLDDLEFIGQGDYTNYGLGIILYFNIVKIGHEKYMSTIAISKGEAK